MLTKSAYRRVEGDILGGIEVVGGPPTRPGAAAMVGAVERRRSMRASILPATAAALALCALAAPLPALGASPNLPGAGAIQQYIESIPTATGSQAAGVGAKKTSIPPAIKRRIVRKAGSNAPLLEHVVASQSYGAPPTFSARTTPAPVTQPVRRSRPARSRPARSTPATRAPAPRQPVVHTPAAQAVLPPAPGAASTALGSFGGGGWLFLLVLVAAIAAVPLARRLGVSPRSGSDAAGGR
jgi:hypothetical protein